MDYLAINIGSSSKKYSFESKEEGSISMIIERRESGYFLSIDHGEKESVEENAFVFAFDHFLEILKRAVIPRRRL
ncbi:MAG: hypothetical protein U5L75_03845 [Candidatus Campbellbacteria bacterium]|nr:hypothetical protein [Candidatus Campbellbacteria bacterium]